MSAAIASKFHKVSRKVSPLEVLERAISILSTLAERRLAAASNVVRVRVEFSKNKFITVRPSSKLLVISWFCSLKKDCAVSRIWVRVSLERPSMVKKCFKCPSLFN